MGENDSWGVAEEIDSLKITILESLVETISFGVVADDDTAVADNLTGDLNHLKSPKPINDHNIEFGIGQLA